MSIYHVSKALKTDYKANTKLILIVLADCADENGYCFPSYDHIKKHASIVNRNAISENLKKLENDGAINKTRRFNDSNFYQVFPSEYDNRTSTVTGTLTTKRESNKQNANSKRFIPPTEDEIQNYCLDKNYDYKITDGFIDFYDSKNWMVGKNKMTSWRGALSGWVKRKTTEKIQTKSNDIKSLRTKHTGEVTIRNVLHVIDDYGIQNTNNGKFLSESEERIVYDRLSK